MYNFGSHTHPCIQGRRTLRNRGVTSPIFGTGDTIMSVTPTIFEELSQVKLFCLLISWHFISPKRIFYFNVDKEASSPRHPTMALRLNPAGGLLGSSRDPVLCPLTVERDRRRCLHRRMWNLLWRVDCFTVTLNGATYPPLNKKYPKSTSE